MLKTKEHDPKYWNLLKIETDPEELHFSPKSFAHKFWSFCCCFLSIRLKNILIKSLGLYVWNLPKVTNQHLTTCFCTQTIRTSFLVILLLFSTNTVKNLHVPKVEYHLHENLPKMKTNTRWLRFSPKSFVHNFRSFCYCFPSIRLKNITVKSLGHWHENSKKLQTNTWWLLFAPKPSAHDFRSFCCCFPSIWLKNAQNKRTGP